MGWNICLLLLSIVLLARQGNTLSILTIYSDPSEVYNDAGWGAWGGWEPCSRSCGGGITYMQRDCRNTTFTGCAGEDKMYSTCNIQDCPVHAIDFRVKQCAEFNDIKQYKGSLQQWIPFYSDDPDHNPCSLYCQSQNSSHDVVKLKEKVTDGTRCRMDSYHSCIDGKCQEMGCDMILGSSLRLDSCGECGGDGTSCKLSKGRARISKDRTHYLFTLPPGATNIKVYRMRSAKSYIQIKDSSGSIVVGRNETQQNFKLIYAAGVDIFYQRKYKKRGRKPLQSLFIPGPTAEKLQFEIIALDKVRSILYEYYLPIGAIVIKNSFEWKINSLGNCTKACDKGWQRRDIKCSSQNDVISSSSACLGLKKPKTWIPCNEQECQISWQAEPWGECSSSCGGGKQTRDIYCVEQSPFPGRNDIILKNRLCNANNKMERERSCNMQPCQEWRTSNWSQCSVTCGSGSKTRGVECVSNSCDDEIKPQDHTPCNAGPCSDVNWVVTEWTECTEGCGKGMTTRIVECADNDGVIYPNSTYCNTTEKPAEILPCYSTRNCPDPPKWMTGSWSPCSVNCGSGIQTRRVACSVFAEGAIRIFPDDQCLEASASAKPSFLQNCVKPKCQSLWFSGVWGPCSVTCGTGIRNRRVFCGNMDGKTSGDQSCEQLSKPNQTEICSESICATEPPDCQLTSYGCCPDGFTPARGPNHIGCNQPAPTQPRRVTALDCHLPVDQGPCTSWEVKWQYNPEQKLCVRFWFGGCDGNANKFSSEHECLKTCTNTDTVEIVTSTTTQSTTQLPQVTTESVVRLGRCLAPPDRGSCPGNYKRWHFDDSMGDCVQFFYSGCGGNENNFGSRESCLSMCNEAFITINETIDHVSAVKGATATLPCPVTAYPTPQVRWLHQNGSFVHGERAIVRSDFSLEIREVDLSDADTYTCEVQNSAGLGKTHSVLLNVQPDSLFYQIPANTSVDEGETAIVQCRITAEVVFITWHKDGVQIHEDESHRIQAWGDLHILDANKEDEGKYICSAYSADAVKTVSAYLTVKEQAAPRHINSSPRYAAAYRQPSTSYNSRIKLLSHPRRTSSHHCKDKPSVNCHDVIVRNLCSIYRAYCCESCKEIQ